jgi:hypothetical protein
MQLQSNNQVGKQDLKSAYNGFLNSAAGKDLLRQAQTLEKAFVLQGVKAQTSDEKAHALCRMEGVVALRDYMIRMSKAKK